MTRDYIMFLGQSGYWPMDVVRFILGPKPPFWRPLRRRGWLRIQRKLGWL